MTYPVRVAKNSLALYAPVLMFLSFAYGCRRSDSTTSVDAAAHVHPAGSEATTTPNPSGDHERVLPWIENDWDEAFRLARRDKKKVFSFDKRQKSRR